MANVQVFQRHAHLAGAVKLEFVNGREGKIAKGVLTAISNTRKGKGSYVLDVNFFDELRIDLATADDIRTWSHGEVKKPAASTRRPRNAPQPAHADA